MLQNSKDFRYEKFITDFLLYWHWYILVYSIVRDLKNIQERNSLCYTIFIVKWILKKLRVLKIRDEYYCWILFLNYLCI